MKQADTNGVEDAASRKRKLDTTVSATDTTVADEPQDEEVASPKEKKKHKKDKKKKKSKDESEAGETEATGEAAATEVSKEMKLTIRFKFFMDK